MGLFDWIKKQPSSDDAANQIAHRWQEAFRATPGIYQNKATGVPFGSLTLTQGVDTILPLHPERQWAVDGQPVSRWILGLVSITENRILGHLDYSVAIERLQPFVLAEAEDRMLVGAMTHQQLDKLLEGLPTSVI